MNQINHNFYLTEDDEEALERICPRGTHAWLGFLLCTLSATLTTYLLICFGQWIASFFA